MRENVFEQAAGLARKCREGFVDVSRSSYARLRSTIACRRGQGTTEYAILVGVLVVIAILAITMFRPKIQQLWDAIANGINGL